MPSARLAFAHSSPITGDHAKRVVEPGSFDAQQHESALSTARSLREPKSADEGQQVQSLLREMSRPHAHSTADMSLQFLHRKVPSRFAYDSWTGVETGYGQFLQD